MINKDKLFDKFPPVTTEQWMEKITLDLKGADFGKKLVWKTREGFDVMPFYREEDMNTLNHIGILPGCFPYVRGSRVNHNSWLIRQDISVMDFRKANYKALDILMKGVNSLGFIIADPEDINVDNITQLLSGISCESVELNFVTAGKARELVASLLSLLWASETNLSGIHGSIAADPLGRLAANGKLCVPVGEGLDYLADLINDTAGMPDMRSIVVGGTLFSNAGAGVAEELAYSLAMGNEYLAAMKERGVSADLTASKMKFDFGIGGDFFIESAKLRAARMLWALVVKGYSPKREENALMNIHSVTGRWNKTLYDPYVNMLRTQTEAMSAVLGGADSVTVEPFDIVYKTPDEFSERIARNQQLLLMEEAHLDKVADPGAGSYYLEKLTSLIASQAWDIFLEVEKEGGFLEAVKKGLIQKRIAGGAETRRVNVAKRREIILGTNQYPNFTEAKAPEADPAKLSGPQAADDAEVKQILPSRAASDFEKLRLDTQKAGHRPLAFMLTIGNLAMRRARAQFSSNFFACAGYEVRDNNGFTSSEEGVKAAMEAKADIIVICSSDEDYEIVAHDIYTMAKDKALVVVAGTPPCMEKLKAEGMEYFISIRSDVLETLRMFNKKLGIN